MKKSQVGPNIPRSLPQWGTQNLTKSDVQGVDTIMIIFEKNRIVRRKKRFFWVTLIKNWPEQIHSMREYKITSDGRYMVKRWLIQFICLLISAQAGRSSRNRTRSSKSTIEKEIIKILVLLPDDERLLFRHGLMKYHTFVHNWQPLPQNA